MPELPEVEVVRARPRAPRPSGRTITAVEVLHPRPVRRDPGGPTGFAAALTGRTIEAARRRGKYLWLPLDNGDALLGHLGMSGQMLVQPAGAPDERHLRVRFTLPDDGGAALRRPADVRRAARSRRPAPSCPPEIAHIARDPLDPEFDDGRVRPPRARAVRRASSGSCSTRTWSRASATSTPTRRCGARRSTASGRGTG